MLDPARVDAVRALIGRIHPATGKPYSQRAIAAKTGVSRGTVAGIYHGRRPDYPARQREREEPNMQGPVARCDGCGAMVAQPCVACRVRQWGRQHPEQVEALRAQARIADRVRPAGTPALDLTDEQLALLAEIRAAKIAVGESRPWTPPVAGPRVVSAGDILEDGEENGEEAA